MFLPLIWAFYAAALGSIRNAMIALTVCIFNLRRKWRTKARIDAANAASPLFENARAQFAIATTNDGHPVDITRWFNCLADQQMISPTRVLSDKYKCAFIHLAPPFTNIRAIITKEDCATIRIDIGENEYVACRI